MKIKLYSNWGKHKNVFTPCLWYSSDGLHKGTGIDIFGFGIYLTW